MAQAATDALYLGGVVFRVYAKCSPETRLQVFEALRDPIAQILFMRNALKPICKCSMWKHRFSRLKIILISRLWRRWLFSFSPPKAGLHCVWEIRYRKDPRALQELSVASGLSILKEYNPYR
jgi:hypothetical protein